LIVDWHEVWSREYWIDYLGLVGGMIGYAVQRLCVRLPSHSFVFSRLHARRLAEEGHRAPIVRLTGEYAQDGESGEPDEADLVGERPPLVVFAGRHIPEKRAPALLPALAKARERIPELRGEIYGDGPERELVLRAIGESGLDGSVVAPGFVDAQRLQRAMETALCLVLPSSREGYGLVVVEAASRGVPVVVVEGPDNAATELVGEGVNGALATSPAPDELAAAIVRVHRAGVGLRQSTLDWFRRNAERLSLERSLEIVERAYARTNILRT
jgi:glycosyltransferase involved in cell wall biosynthesis